MALQWLPRRALVIGIFRERKSLSPVLKSLRDSRFYRSANAHLFTDRKIGGVAWIEPIYVSILILVLTAGFGWSVGPLILRWAPLSPAVRFIAGVLILWIVTAWILLRILRAVIERRIFRLMQQWVLPGESIVVISTTSSEAAAAAKMVLEAAGEHPAVFVIHQSGPVMQNPLPRANTALGEPEIFARARKLAHDLKDTTAVRSAGTSLRSRLDHCEAVLAEVQSRLAGAAQLEQTIALSAEWLLDNAYIIRGHIEDFRRNLPPQFYRQLPIAASGAWAGYPRVYAIACELVSDWDGSLSRNAVKSFLQTFQSETTLISAELWALPMMVRLRLIENLASLSAEVERRQRESEKAAFWANRLLFSARYEPERLNEILGNVIRESPDPPPNVVEELISHLYDEEAALTPVRSWLQAKFAGPLEDVIRQQELLETGEQVSLTNSITTLRALSQFNWNEIFEEVSHVEAVLWSDPALVYSAMDFETRDRYRHRIELLSRRSKLPEEKVAEEAINLALRGADDLTRHVGYYLVDAGARLLEKNLSVKATIRERSRRWVLRHAAPLYLTSICTLTVILTLIALRLSAPTETNPALATILTLLFVLPAADLAIKMTNYVVTRCLQPLPLPKMSFEDGIPDTAKTLVVIPMMLLTLNSIKDEAERLEIRSLANPDKNLIFALLADYADAPQQHMPEDLEMLDVARRAIEELNEKYGRNRFVLFYRDRLWSDCEQCWMGWERKRGKLEQLNSFLLASSDPNQAIKVAAGPAEIISNITFVITLDADTQLPRDTARRLVATIAHPINKPRLSADGRKVLRGYTIIQPRVSTSLPSATASHFARMFTDPSGVDPYTHAVSDVYQDLAGAGSYHGKGIYDLNAFHSVLDNRFPEARLLSHDLIEGAYARTGLGSDIELLDLFPETYLAYCARMQRWIRGDWQIARWLLPSVPSGANGVEPNPLTAIDLWKILDNLRRALTPAAVLAMLIFGCALSPRPEICAGLVAVLLISNMLFPLATRLTQRWKFDPVMWQEPVLNLARSVLFIAALPHQAYISLQATVVALFRITISRRKLLEWATSSGSRSKAKLANLRKLITRVGWAPLFAVAAVWLVMHAHPSHPFLIVPFAILWSASPFVLAWLDHPTASQRISLLTEGSRENLRIVARATWRFFDEFVNADSNHLPPDNYQATLRVEIAERTSPTNIGLYMLSTLAANDFGYIGPEQVLLRLRDTVSTLERLEKYRGHLLNWYETKHLQPLGQPYVSSVDSGNFLGSLWALQEGLEGLRQSPVVGNHIFEGLADTLRSISSGKSNSIHSKISAVSELLDARRDELFEIADDLRTLRPAADDLATAVNDHKDSTDNSKYWAQQLQSQIGLWLSIIDKYFPWLEILERPPESGILSLGANAHALRRMAMSNVPSIGTLAARIIPGVTELTALKGSGADLPAESAEWLSRLSDAVANSSAAAQEMQVLIADLLAKVGKIDNEMDLAFLYDPNRRLFAVGYNVADQRLDGSYYDLLASEARLCSFLAIARDEVPTEHWWSLGRPFGTAYFKRALLSWNGTMFEYLMPLLLTRSYANSLLDKGCRIALDCQITYAKKRGIPWGVSEAAFSELDSRQVYQYRAFGVPGLAIKRGLEDDYVVSPYSAALALAVDPVSAARHLRKSGPLSRLGLWGDYGFYESIDFTRHRGPEGERGIVVRTYMAHHQGMILLAIDNAVKGDVMQNRFHADPRVKAAASLLYERVPVGPPLVKSNPNESYSGRLGPITTIPLPGRVETSDTTTPRVGLLSNGEYHAMLTNSGGGYSRWRDFDITRWRADPTSDDWGKFCYFKDLDSGFIWSSALHPIGARTKPYHVIFSAEKVEYRKRDRGIETITEVVVSPEDDAEVWRITLINRSTRPRQIEVTTYTELALADHASDRAHPAFSKLFIQTAMHREIDALLAWRRPKAPDEKQIWVTQVIADEGPAKESVPFETDRARFIGRGRSPRSPIALEQNLTDSEGYVLDPIFSLRSKLEILPGERAQLILTTAAATTREHALALAAKYRDPESAKRAFHLAWTQAQLEQRHLRLTPAQVQLFQTLAGYMLYPHRHLRASPKRIARNRMSQRDLWAHGISGDLPIIVVTIDELEQMDIVDDVLAAHAFWHVRGFKCDLVILNEEGTNYYQTLHSELQRRISSRSHVVGIDQPGGVFLRVAKQISPEEVNLILSVAHVVLVAGRGPLTQQIGMPVEPPIPIKQPKPTAPEQPSVQLPFEELDYFNGLGGFSKDGLEYVIFEAKNVHTPRPWSNVIANPSFGTIVTDEGNAFTWFGNSQSNRLTCWSNDPISNPSAEAIYIYDASLNALWTPTPFPIRENDPYRIRHGQGYSVFEHNSHAINHELTTYVPLDPDSDATVRVQILKLTNTSSRRRSLSLTQYVEWTMGTNPESMAPNVVTTWDLASKAVFARNAFMQPDPDTVAFAANSLNVDSFTADRAEVLGRNQSMVDLVGLRNTRLSGSCGGGLDPCAAIQGHVDILPNESIEIVFLVGSANSEEEARQTIARFRRTNESSRTLGVTQDAWDRILGAIVVETPDKATNLMLNRWLLYQVLSCRYWGRSGLYQSSGAYGYRDQLQDVLALLYAKPEIAREHILRCASRQFPEGDVQHWWHPKTGAGVRTRISDDLLWLPFVTTHYINVTGDRAILDEVVPFIDGPLLDKGEHDCYFVATVSSHSENLWEHCRRAIDKASTSGRHGLPLMGAGDWNDGMNRVGIAGKGESVWLAMFLCKTLQDFADLADARDAGTAAEYRRRGHELSEHIDESAWDGEWYLRAFFDDGTPLGSKESPEAKIDSLPQAWAAISGAVSKERTQQAMDSVTSHLVDEQNSLVRLFDPPFDHSLLEPGYIKGYPPGVRENGGQYTHGSLWVPMAWARLGNGDEAVRLLQMMNPINLGSKPEQYLVEPYVLAGDVFTCPSHMGMGGWSWYTGSASWMYRIWIEEVLGFKKQGDQLRIEPVIPGDWPGFKLTYRYKSTTYVITVDNSAHDKAGTWQSTLDARPVEASAIQLVDDGAQHEIAISRSKNAPEKAVIDPQAGVDQKV